MTLAAQTPQMSLPGHPPVTDPDARQDRLDALTGWDRERLLAYLDGRAPAYVDEWFEKQQAAAASQRVAAGEKMV